jgi:hypothetical protein
MGFQYIAQASLELSLTFFPEPLKVQGSQAQEAMSCSQSENFMTQEMLLISIHYWNLFPVPVLVSHSHILYFKDIIKGSSCL